MKYIIFDMEWNQPMTREKRGDHGVQLIGEVFQIGAVRLREDGSRDGAFCENVSLRFYKKLHYHVRKICGMKEKDLEGCRSFPEVVRDFAAFWGEDGILFSWGPDDVPMLRDNMKAYGVSDVEIPPYYDLQRIFANQITHESRQVALEDAMAEMGVPHRFNMHNAFADALNTASIAQLLDIPAGIRKLEEEQRIYRLLNIHLEDFPSVRAALAHPKLKKITCPFCDRELTGRIEKAPRVTRVIKATCPEHGPWSYRIKVSKQPTGRFNADMKIAPAREQEEPAEETSHTGE